MPVPLEIELDWRGKRFRDVERGLRAIADDVERDFDEAFKPIAMRVLRKYMEGVIQSVQQRVSTPYPGGTSPGGSFPGTLSRRSGRLRASIDENKIEVKDQGGDVTVGFTLTGIAVVHENGAVIRAKSAQYLTIPLPAALNANGTPKRPSARSWPNTFVLRSKKGNLLIVQKNGKDITPLYVLKKSVTIPKRLAFKEAFEAGRDFVADQLAAELLKEFNNA